MKLLRRLNYLWNRRRLEAELREEMQVHQRMVQDELEENGLAAKEASLAGRRAMGAAALMGEDARGVWISPWLESIGQDLAYGARSLRKQPGFAAVAIVALALGIGLNTSLFTVFNAVALRPWSVREPARVVRVFGVLRNVEKQFDTISGFSFVEYRYLAEHTKSMTGLFMMRGEGGLRTDVGKVRAAYVTANYFRVLGVEMERGRGFMAEEDRSESPLAVVVLNYTTWQNRFGGDPEVIGRRIRIEELPFTIVGVTPPDFFGTNPEPTDLWLPFSGMVLLSPNDSWPRTFLRDRNSCCADVAGRLAPGISREQARAELGLLRVDFHNQFGEKSLGVVLAGTAPLQSIGRKAKNFYAVFALMFAGVMLVLLLACANVGNLLLARAAARRREIGVRLSLGAGRARVVRQLLTESLLLAGIASALGVFVAWVLPRPLFTRIVGAVSFPLRPDAAVLAFTLGLAALACIAFGLAPALHATRGNFSDALKQRHGAPGGRLSPRRFLLTVQVAGSVILLVGAGLMVRGIQHARTLDPGFAVEGTASVSFDFPTSAYQTPRVAGFYRSLTQGLDALPGTRPFGFTALEPLGNTKNFTSFRLPGQGESHENAILTNSVSAGYFETLRIPIVAGRNFGPADTGRDVLLVNQAMADRYFPHESAAGKTVIIDKPLEIVGVVRNAHTWTLDEVEPALYFPISYGIPPRLLLPHTAASQAAVAALAKGLDPRVEMRVTRLSDNLDQWLSATRIAALIAGMLGILALSLAAIGIAGVFAYAVEQRKQEIGIRMALGARPAQVIRGVFGSAARSLVVGLVIGMVGAIAGSSLLRQYIFGLSHLDPITYAAVLMTLAAAGLAATYVPARRATAVDPVEALRQD
jgi:predicted permease